MRAAGGTVPAAEVRARIRSSLWVYLVVLGWLACVFVVLGLPVLLGWLDMSWLEGRLVAGDVFITLVTVARPISATSS